MSRRQKPQVNDVGDSARNTTVVPIAAKNTLFVGAILRDRYVLEQLLGEGGMGRVFLATDREVDGPDRFVAIKVLGDLFREHPQSLSVLRKEATNTRKLTHPNIVRVHTFDRDGPHVFIVMEYIRGESLDHFIRRHKEGLSLHEAWPMIRDCAAALSYMHTKDVVHSDFKPGNVFVTEDGEIKVLDLGLARTIDETVAMDGRTRFDSGQSTQPLGLTPEYASCEMWELGTKPDARDDIYAFGCVTYQLLTGRHPYDNVPAPKARAQQLVPDRPKRIRRRQWQALQQALSFERESRIRTLDLFLREFDRERPRTSAAPWIVLTILLAIGGMTAWFFRTPPLDPDKAFVDEQVASRPTGERKAAKPEDLRGWETQGTSGLQLAQEALDHADYDAAAYYLHDGPTNARFSFERLLARSSAVEDRRAGAEGLLKTSKLHAVAARDLLATKPEEALRWTCLGLQIDRYEPELTSLYQQFEKTLKHAAVAATDACAMLDTKSISPSGDGP